MITKKINKKIIIIVALTVFLATVIIGGYEATHKYIKTVKSHPNIIMYENFDKLHNNADVVVIAKVIGNRENIVDGKDLGQNGYTLTEIEIKNILKNNKSHKLDVNDKIKMTEPYYIMKDDMFKPDIKNIIDGYTELKDDCIYTLALAWNDEANTYSTKGVYQCKYNIDGKDKEELETWDIKDNSSSNRKKRSLDSQESKNTVQKLRKGLFEKYGSEIQKTLEDN
ncbi:hypothetical protein [Tepidibacter hydrothermalis]|uniref:Uncharacterized protein n=1 Tax=Tepidibacter hydrothermalis TaxID=3036126 RepID=A0ABY8E959_9FIRM|nr:hypothetical protein [Tepidibacter hydrothermalis]WFD09427.1 hypothetical protein P4S50_13655 [Tepidibacter hydrothermalis]